MKYTFIIPVFNCEKYLAQCVKSILSLKLKSYEVILIDDGSSDHSGNICDYLASQIQNIKVIHQKNLGVSNARNTGIENAKGEKIIFLDADDMIDSKAMRHCIQLQEQVSNIDMTIYGLSFDYYYKGYRYRRENISFPQKGELNKQQWLNGFRTLYSNNVITPVWNKIFEKDIIDKNHIRFSKKMFIYEDLEFVLKYMSCCNRILNVPAVIYHYRQTEDEGNAKRRLQQVGDLSDVVDPIRHAMDMIIHNSKINSKQMSEIYSCLLLLYLTLAYEKTACSDLKTIDRMCTDAEKWFHKKEFITARYLTDKDRKFCYKLICHQYLRIYLNERLVRLKHIIAVRVKNTRLFQTLKK